MSFEQLNSDKPTREELFIMVWERPATEVAHELGISDVALGKMCRRLQVPKPPRGYWARVKAGRTPRRSPLAAFREESDADIRGRHHKDGRHISRLVTKLSRMQVKFLGRALQELTDAGVDVTDCDLTYEGIRALGADLAAQILILVQNRYKKWVEEGGATARSCSGAYQSISGLVTKLLPLAKEQVVIFYRDTRQGYSGNRDPTIILRLSASMQERIGHLYRLARDNRLSCVVWDLETVENAWSVRHLHAPNSYTSTSSQLCVSEQHAWIRCKVVTTWGTDQFETAQISLNAIVPVDLLPQIEVELPPVMKHSMVRPYAKRLTALRDAEQAFDIILSAAYQIDRAVPDEHLAIMDRLWFSHDVEGPFSRARQVWQKFELDLEKWENRLELEKAELCRQVLGVNDGDNVLFELRGRTVRIQLEGASLYLTDEKVSFQLWGRRYRKDGLPGKRQEYIVLETENNLE